MLSRLKQTHLQPGGYHDVTGYSQIKRSERGLPSYHFSFSPFPSNPVKPPPHFLSHTQMIGQRHLIPVLSERGRQAAPRAAAESTATLISRDPRVPTRPSPWQERPRARAGTVCEETKIRVAAAPAPRT